MARGLFVAVFWEDHPKRDDEEEDTPRNVESWLVDPEEGEDVVSKDAKEEEDAEADCELADVDAALPMGRVGAQERNVEGNIADDVDDDEE